MNYAAEIYRGYLRELIKDMVRKYPDNSEESLEEEIEYLREKIEDEKIGWLFDNFMNKNTYYDILSMERFKKKNSINDAEGIPKLLVGVDFSDIRKKNKEKDIDIIWILQSAVAKLEYSKSSKVDDRTSLKEFEAMIAQMGFSGEEKKIFQYSEIYFYFNALPDHGNSIYQHKNDPILNREPEKNTEEEPEENTEEEPEEDTEKELKEDAEKDSEEERKGGFYAAGNIGRNEALFLSSVKESNWREMHNQLKELLQLWKKVKKAKQDIDFKIIIRILNLFSALVPIVDEESKLKSEEQLNIDQVRICSAVSRYFTKKWKEEGKKYDLQEEILKIFNMHLGLERVFEKKDDDVDFCEEQMIIIIRAYFNYMESFCTEFINKVKEYRELCKGITDIFKSASYNIYDDMWSEVWNNRSWNE